LDVLKEGAFTLVMQEKTPETTVPNRVKNHLLADRSAECPIHPVLMFQESSEEVLDVMKELAFT
jgi:hypothetical protein